jgi:subtilase family serine protease
VSTSLTVVPSGSPFLVRATGSSAQIQRTFHTTLNSFKNPQGTKYFANSTPIYVPGSLAGTAMGVIGLTNTQRYAKNTKHVPHFDNTMRPGAKASSTTNRETSYPTVAQLFSHRVDGNPLVLGYGAGPGCSGLTPSQENSLYDAPNLGARGKGKGVDIAVFELSAYQHSDIATWAHQFYGPGYNPPLVDVNIDGGPLNPECPVGTSLSSPLVSAIIADRDSLHGNRTGNINPTLYREYQIAPSLFFHDVTGAGHIAKNNGLYPTVPGYDEATGIGTIKMAPFIIGSF